MRFQGYSLPATSLGAVRFTHMYMLRRALKDSRQLKREQATAEREEDWTARQVGGVV